MKISTFADLKEFVNSLNEEQLKNKVVAHRTDEWSLNCSDASTLEEDYHIDDYGQMVPNSCFEPGDDEDTLECWDALPKGTPFLYFDDNETVSF